MMPASLTGSSLRVYRYLAAAHIHYSPAASFPGDVLKPQTETVWIFFQSSQPACGAEMPGQVHKEKNGGLFLAN